METLRQLSQNMEQLMAAIALNDGELTDEIAAKYDATREQIEQKVEDYASYISILKGHADMLDAEIRRLQAMKQAKTNLIDRLKGNLLYNLGTLGMDKVKTPLHSVGVRTSNSLDIDPDYLKNVEENSMYLRDFKNDRPFIRVKLEVDKAAITAYVKDGGDMPDFARMVENKSLSIR